MKTTLRTPELAAWRHAAFSALPFRAISLGGPEPLACTSQIRARAESNRLAGKRRLAFHVTQSTLASINQCGGTLFRSRTTARTEYRVWASRCSTIRSPHVE